MRFSRFFRTWLRLSSNLLRRKRLMKNKKRKLSPANCAGFLLIFVFLYLLSKPTPQKELIKLIKANVFQPGFSGATACGNFPCFGSTLCGLKSEKLISVYSSNIRGVDQWLKVSGVIKSNHRVKRNVTFTFPLLKTCDVTPCFVRLSGDMFSSQNYQAWICRKFGFKDGCNVSKVLHDWRPMKEILRDDGRLNPKIIKGLSPPLQCSSARIADRLLRFVLGSRGKGSTNLNDYSYSEKAQLILISKMNPEFLMQRIFPFKEFHFNYAIGVCGLMSLHKGGVEPSLFDFYHAPWYVRVDLAVQLLDLAHYYTENDYNYLLLMHKLTPYDVSLSEERSIRIRNGNNLVLIDKADHEQGFSSKPYEVPFSNADLSISEKDICRHNNTDINFYTVCRTFLQGPWKGINGEVLEGGLLHDPEGLGVFRSKLAFLLDICVRGSIAVPKNQLKFKFSVRKSAAGHLRLLLRTARVCSPEFPYRYPECELYEQSHDLNNLRYYKLSESDIKWLR